MENLYFVAQSIAQKSIYNLASKTTSDSQLIKDSYKNIDEFIQKIQQGYNVIQPKSQHIKRIRDFS